MSDADAAEIALLVFGTVMQDVISSIPVAGSVAGAIFGYFWGKLQGGSTQQQDVTAMMAAMIEGVKKYIDEKLTYAKQQICIDAIASFTSLANDFKVQIQSLPESAPIVINTHRDCVIKARDALHVLYDLEWGHITIHNYAMMASLYLTLLDDGIKDTDNWGIDQSLKETYLDRRARFFKEKEFSNLLAACMDKAGQGNISLRRLFIKTTQVTNSWYCFDPEAYPLGIPEILDPLEANEAAPTNITGHVYFQPWHEKTKCVVNNMPGGYVQQVLARKEESSTWHPYYPNHKGSLLQFVSPDGRYPKTVQVRYYRLADVVASKFIGLDHEIKISFTNGGSVDAPIPGEGAWKGKLIFDTEAVVLDSEHPDTGNLFNRGVGNAARLEYVQLGTLRLDAPCDVYIQWKPTASQARSQVLISAVEIMIEP